MDRGKELQETNQDMNYWKDRYNELGVKAKLLKKIRCFYKYGLRHSLKCRLFHGKFRNAYPLKAWGLWGYTFCGKCKCNVWNPLDVWGHPEVGR